MIRFMKTGNSKKVWTHIRISLFGLVWISPAVWSR